MTQDHLLLWVELAWDPSSTYTAGAQAQSLPFPLCPSPVSCTGVCVKPGSGWALWSPEGFSLTLGSGTAKGHRPCYCSYTFPWQELLSALSRWRTFTSRQQDSRPSGFSLSSPRWAKARWQSLRQTRGGAAGGWMASQEEEDNIWSLIGLWLNRNHMS